MNVLVVIHYPIFGGPHNRVLRLTEPLRHRGVNTVALLPDETGNAAGRLRAGGVHVIQIPLHRLRATRDPRAALSLLARFLPEITAIRETIQREDIDAVVVGGLVNPHAAIAGRLEGKAVVWQVLDTRTPLVINRLLFALVRHLADAAMFAGQTLVDDAGPKRLGRVPTFVVTPKVDPDRFVPSPSVRTNTRAAWGVPQDIVLVGTVANLNPMKGLEYFVQAAMSIYKTRQDTAFVIVGAEYANHAQYAERIRAAARETGIPANSFVFAGERDDIENAYPAMDVKLITSVPHSEGTPTTALEAMSCGVPVVTTDVGSARHAVLDREVGRVVPARNAAALAAATLSVLETTEACRLMGHRARQRIIDHYSLSVGTDQYLQVLDAAGTRLATRTRRRGLLSALRAWVK